MPVEYIHSPLNVQVESISGHYVNEKEMRLPHKDREVLVVFGYAMVDKSCCGTGGFKFATVPGYVVEWQSGKTPNNEPVSMVEPIRDENEKLEIHDLIDKTEVFCQVNFL